METETWAIVVGINAYPQGAHQKDLGGAVADACDFAEWALNPLGGNVPPKRMLFWSHPWPNPLPAWYAKYQAGGLPSWYEPDTGTFSASPDPTRPPDAEDIVLTAEKLGEAFYEAKLDNPTLTSRIYVFLAGHGLRAPVIGEGTLQTCFVAGDFRSARNVALGLVPTASLSRSLRTNRFDEVLMFLDCCRTDPPSVTFKAMPICDLCSNDDEIPGTSVGHATHPSGRAFETNGPPVRGAFSKTLMDGLRGYRDPGSNRLTVQSLETYVLANIRAAITMDQRPFFHYRPIEPPMVVVTGAPATPFPPGPLVYIEIVTGSVLLEVVDTHSKSRWTGGPYPAGSPPVQLPSLEPNLYGLRIVGGPTSEILFRQPLQREIHVR